ncbi:MAG: TetR/AcrR family transcriptional regulator [Gammaproteobacteria bacterium]|nr:TetR/AcrR family transcriptional regulator [Gammaproteobacteria bacterium]
MSSNKSSITKRSYRVDAVRRLEVGRGRRKKNLQKLLRSSVELLAKNGFERSTIQEIAAASHMSLRTFYNYFPRKQDVAAAVEYLLYEVATQTGERPIPDDYDVVERVAFGLLSNLHLAIREPAITSVYFELYLSRYPEVEHWVRANQQFRKQYAEGVRQGVFAELTDSVLQNFLFTPIHFVGSQLPHLQSSKQQALIEDSVVQALSVLGVPRKKAESVVAKLTSASTVDSVNTQRAYESIVDRLLD